MKFALFVLTSIFFFVAHAQNANLYKVQTTSDADYAKQACEKANKGINPGDPNPLRIGCYDVNYVPLSTVDGLDVLNYKVKLDSALNDPNLFDKTSAAGRTGSKSRKGSRSTPTDR